MVKVIYIDASRNGSRNEHSVDVQAHTHTNLLLLYHLPMIGRKIDNCRPTEYGFMFVCVSMREHVCVCVSVCV